MSVNPHKQEEKAVEQRTQIHMPNQETFNQKPWRVDGEEQRKEEKIILRYRSLGNMCSKYYLMDWQQTGRFQSKITKIKSKRIQNDRLLNSN